MDAEPKGIGKRAIDPDYESHILRSDVKRLCAELKESRAELKEAHAELSDGHMVRYDLEEAQNDLVRVRKQLKDEQDIGRKADLAFFARLQADRLERDAEFREELDQLRREEIDQLRDVYRRGYGVGWTRGLETARNKLSSSCIIVRSTSRAFAP